MEGFNVQSSPIRAEILQLDAKFCLFDVTGNSIVLELLVKPDRLDSSIYPAPFGKYVVFPNPGNLEEVKFKAQPEPALVAAREPAGSDMRQVNIAYSALNFRDVMLAYNKIDKDCLVGHSKHGDGWGLEFSGIDTQTKTKVMGLSYNSIGTNITVNKNLLWELDQSQSLAEFATVPCVYATSYYSLLIRAQMQPTTSVLIHAGAGGVGQSALYICLHRTADPKLVFTTCSFKKRRYLMEKFGPLGLLEENIGNTRDCTFEDMIMEQTGGKGVDVVLNSLSDEKLQASVRCMAPLANSVKLENMTSCKTLVWGCLAC